MKHLFKNLVLLFFILFSGLFSCKTDNGDQVEKESTLTAEQQKERLDQEGINFIDHLEDMEKPDLMDPLMYFIDISQYLEDDQFDLSAKVARNIIVSSKKHSVSPLKSLVTNDATSFKKMMDDNQGVYTYNRNYETWKKTSGAAGEIKFVFPANKSTTSNNTTFIFKNLTTKSVSNYDLYEDLDDLPKTLDVSLKVDNVEKYGYSISNEYNGDDIPIKESTMLAIAPYKFTENYALSNDNMVAFNSTMSKSNVEFMTISATSDGDFTNSLFTADSIVEEDIVKKVNVSMQIENVKIVGNLEFKNLAKRLNELDLQYEKQYNSENDQYPKAYYDDYVSAFMENGTVRALFVDKNEFFAKLIPYVSSETDWYYKYNPKTYYYDRIEYDRNFIDFKIEFTDGSKVDDSYFDEGFSEFVDKLNSIIRRINSDYDEEIDEVEY